MKEGSWDGTAEERLGGAQARQHANPARAVTAARHAVPACSRARSRTSTFDVYPGEVQDPGL